MQKNYNSKPKPVVKMNDSIYILDDTVLASTGKRFLNYIIDMIFFVILMYVFGLFLGILIAFGFEGISFWMQGLGDLSWNFIGITILLVYYTLTEGFFGRSVGKFITGTVVVDENGEKINFGSALKRSLCRLIPFDGLSFFGSRGWHDSITETYVVEKKALEESIKMFYDFKLIGIEEAS